MPYINPNLRPAFDEISSFLEYLLNENPMIKDKKFGILNYFITTLLMKAVKPSSYEDYMKIIGTLSCIEHEIYRRVVSKYEDKKRKENSDVF